MSEDAKDEPLDQPLSGTRQYQIVAAAGLLVLTLPLFARGLGAWSLLPLVVGVAFGLLTWRGGPYMVLLSLIFLVVCDTNKVTPVDIVAGCMMGCSNPGDRMDFEHDARSWGLEERVPILDMVMGVGLLAYLMGAFRLLGLQKNILPVDPRRRVKSSTRRQEARVGRLPPPRPQVRSETLVQPKESVFIALTAVGVALLSLLFGLWLLRRTAYADLETVNVFLRALTTENDWDPFTIDMSNETWQLFVLLWSVGLMLIAFSGVLAYVGMIRRRPEEAQLYLQDQLWKETRREQSRIARWMTWAALDWRQQHPVEPAATPTSPLEAKPPLPAKQGS